MEPESLVVILPAVVTAVSALMGSRGMKPEVDAVLDRLEEHKEHATPLPGEISTRPQRRYRIDPRRQAGPGPGPNLGQLEIAARVGAYERALSAEAKKVAKGFHSTEPSKKHVEMAAHHLGLSRSSRLVAVADVALALGAILVGVGVSYEVNLWTGGTAGSNTAVPALICTLAGTAIAVAAATIKIMRQG